MRIISGEAKGRRIEAAEGADIRPTTDRAREAIFNSLFSLGGVESLKVADLFAGTGALGLEALSRGAAHATFVESSAAALKILRSNIADLGCEDRSAVISGDVMSELVSGGQLEQQGFDLAFCDPPYAFDRWDELLSKLNCRILVAESNRKIKLNSCWKCLKNSRYATTFITIAANRARPSPKKRPDIQPNSPDI